MEENKIKPTIAIPTEARLVFPELKSIKFPGLIFAANLYGYKIFIIELVQDLRGDMSHFCPFLRNESRPAESTSPILFSTD